MNICALSPPAARRRQSSVVAPHGLRSRGVVRADISYPCPRAHLETHARASPPARSSKPVVAMASEKTCRSRARWRAAVRPARGFTLTITMCLRVRAARSAHAGAGRPVASMTMSYRAARSVARISKKMHRAMAARSTYPLQRCTRPLRIEIGNRRQRRPEYAHLRQVHRAEFSGPIKTRAAERHGPRVREQSMKLMESSPPSAAAEWHA